VAALDVIPQLWRAVSDGTTVAVVADDDNAVVGEICPGVLFLCDIETVSAAFVALSAGDTMAFIDCSLWHSPSEFLVRAIRAQLAGKGLDAMAELMERVGKDAAVWSKTERRHRKIM